MKAEFFVKRNALDELTFAIVKADVSREELAEERPFLAALMNAVTEWVKTTKNGKAAWKESSADFNVGDLSGYSNDKQLVPLLKKNGINSLDIDCEAHTEGADYWSYDTVLAEPDEDPIEEEVA